MSFTDAIIIENLRKEYQDVVAVENLNLRVPRGELFGLLGPNGAGKSTTINVLCGIVKPTRGKVLVGEKDVQKDPDQVKALIGVCPQEPAVFTFLTGRENIELFGALAGMSKDAIQRRTESLLEMIGLVEGASRQTKKYSGGMIRRISLVMSLIQDPEIAFLDEPTAAMDPQSRRAVWDFIKDLKARGKTVILTTHYIEEAQALCDRVGIIDHGKLIALDTPQKLMEKHQAANLEDVFIKLTGRQIREDV
jgi:ABC-2 type transport system ATP-binding protein